MSRSTPDNTMGAAFIAVVIAAMLYGVSCIQVRQYYRHYYNADAWPTRAVVALTWACDTIHQVLITHAVYTYVITNYDTPVELTNIVWSLIVEVLFNGITALLVQSFFTIRIWKLSNRNKILTTVIAALVLAEFGSVLAYVAQALQMKTFDQLNVLKPLSMTINALAVAADVLIAAVFCTVLHNSKTGFTRSNTMINKLIVFSVNTGLLTSICAIGSLVSIIVSPTAFFYVGFFFILGRLYCNSLLATLNERRAIRNSGNSCPYSEMIGGFNNASPTPRKDITIKVETSHEFITDRRSSDPDRKLEICSVVQNPS